MYRYMFISPIFLFSKNITVGIIFALCIYITSTQVKIIITRWIKENYMCSFAIQMISLQKQL